MQLDIEEGVSADKSGSSQMTTTGWVDIPKWRISTAFGGFKYGFGFVESTG